MKKQILFVLAGFLSSSIASAGLFDELKNKLKEANEGIDKLDQQVNDVNREISEINSEFDEMKADIDSSVNETKETYSGITSNGSSRNVQTSMSNSIPVKSFTSEKYSFDIKGIKLGDTIQRVKTKQPGITPSGGDGDTYVLSQSKSTFQVKLAEDMQGQKYVHTMYLQQNLGPSSSVSCENRAKGIESKLSQKYGSAANKSVENDTRGTNYYSQWNKTVPGSQKHSKLLAKVTCVSDGGKTLQFTLIAKGKYIEESLNAQKVSMQNQGSRSRGQEQQADF